MIRLLRAVEFDLDQDLALIADLAGQWRGMFRSGTVESLPSAVLPRMEALARAERLCLYLVTTPAKPLPLAILDGLSQNDAIDLLALAPSGLAQDEVRPFFTKLVTRRRLMGQAPASPAGRGVFAFLLGRPGGAAWIDLEPEGLILTMARWGELNVLDHQPLMARRLRDLARRVGHAVGDDDET